MSPKFLESIKKLIKQRRARFRARVKEDAKNAKADSRSPRPSWYAPGVQDYLNYKHESATEHLRRKTGKRGLARRGLCQQITVSA